MVETFAVFIGALIFVICFFHPRSPGMEEVVVFNAVYTYAHTGQMAFPVYGLDYASSFGIHPHLHYAILGLLLRSGLTLYTAEAVTIFTFALIAVLLVVRGKFPDTVKTGLLMGLYGTIVLAVMYLPDEAVGVRPELHVSIAWFAGLVALESARLDDWHIPTLCLGVMLVACAAAMQNYAFVAPLGLVVYLAWMLRTLSARDAFRRIVACVIAGSVVAIPFLVLYVAPNWAMIRTNVAWGTTHQASFRDKLIAYFAVYDPQFVPNLWRDLIPAFFAAGPMLLTLLLHVPLLLVASAILLTRRSTRAMALAFLPVPFFVLWLRPEAQYFISEIIIFLSAVWIGALTLYERLVLKASEEQPWLAPWILVGTGAIFVLLGSPPLRASHPLAGMPLHEMDVARAAARQIVGPNAVVASRHQVWYMSGGAAWYRMETDITEPTALTIDARRYAAQFDAIADYSLYSSQTQSGTTPSSLYADGAVELKGFYLAQRMPNISMLLFQASRHGPVVGFYMRGDRLTRFDQDASGAMAFVTVRHPLDRACDAFAGEIHEPRMLDLPGTPAATISASLLPREAYMEKRATLADGCDVVDAVFGRLSDVDAHALVAASMASDATIRFPRAPYEEVVLKFLERPDHPIARADACTVDSLQLIRPSTPISSGHYASGLEAPKAFDGDATTAWGSAKLGARNRLVSWIGGDFGSAGAVGVRALKVQHTLDRLGSVPAAVLMSSDTGYEWQPAAAVALETDAKLHTYCVPPTGTHRFWILLATSGTGDTRVWEIFELEFYR